MDELLRFYRDMSRSRLVTMVITVSIVLAFIIYMSMRFSQPAMTPIYTELGIDDSGKIVSELEKSGTPYELRANGSEILVPSDQVLRLRLSLAQSGLPSGGSIVGYEIFDRSETLGTSSFVMNINMLRALEGELSRTISSITQVDSARVHLVVPRQELFSRDRQDPTASVVLKLRGISELSKEQIGAISHLVATAVPGLKPSKVTIVDTKGKMLSRGTGDDSDAVASNADEFKLNYERRMKDTLEQMLERSLGTGKIKVTVNADIDFDRIVTNSETYDPNGQVARSVQTGEEKEQANEKEGQQNTTAGNNLPNAAANQNANGSNRVISKTDETTNYEISKTVQNHVKEAGKVNKLSVAVLVDGTYAGEVGKEVYTPRSDDERKQVEQLVKSAMGYDEKRGDQVQIVNMRFIPLPDDAASFTFMEWVKNNLHGIIQTIVMGLVAIMGILFVARPIVAKLVTLNFAPAASVAGGEAPGLLTGGAESPRLTTGGGGGGAVAGGNEGGAAVDLDRVANRVRSSNASRLSELVEQHPDEAVGVLRQWALKQPS